MVLYNLGMIAKLIILPDLIKRKEEIKNRLFEYGIAPNHPNLLWLGEEEKLGIEQARKIKEHLLLKPYRDNRQAIAILCAENMTLEAQNALLKTLEELPEESVVFLGASSEEQLLPTVVSRCRIIGFAEIPEASYKPEHKEVIEELLMMDPQRRFQLVEKLEEKAVFLNSLAAYFRRQLLKTKGQDTQLKEFVKDIIICQKWANQSVNIRGILEYLMLKMPGR